MTALKFIYFEGCPNAANAKALLREIGVSFQEIRQDDLPEADQFRAYTSPTILDGNEIVMGARTEGSGGGCSVGIPSSEDLRRRLNARRPKDSQDRGSILSVVGSIFSSLVVGFCPVCIPAIGAFLSAIGMGFLIRESILRPLLLVFLAVTLFGYIWSFLKEHGRLGPLIFGIVFAIGLYFSRYIYLGAVINTVLMYGSIAGIITTSLWNIRLKSKRKFDCCACSTNTIPEEK